jgi:hypothetical protein
VNRIIKLLTHDSWYTKRKNGELYQVSFNSRSKNKRGITCLLFAIAIVLKVRKYWKYQRNRFMRYNTICSPSNQKSYRADTAIIWEKLNERLTYNYFTTLSLRREILSSLTYFLKEEQNYNFASYTAWVRKLVCHCEVGTQNEGLWEQYWGGCLDLNGRRIMKKTA